MKEDEKDRIENEARAYHALVMNAYAEAAVVSKAADRGRKGPYLLGYHVTQKKTVLSSTTQFFHTPYRDPKH